MAKAPLHLLGIPKETTLENLIKAIKAATKRQRFDDPSIPIYLDLGPDHSR